MNPINQQAADVLFAAMGSVVPGPGLPERFRHAMVEECLQHDATVLQTALEALKATGHGPEDFEGNLGFGTLQTAVSDAIRILRAA